KRSSSLLILSLAICSSPAWLLMLSTNACTVPPASSTGLNSLNACRVATGSWYKDSCREWMLSANSSTAGAAAAAGWLAVATGVSITASGATAVATGSLGASATVSGTSGILIVNGSGVTVVAVGSGSSSVAGVLDG